MSEKCDEDHKNAISLSGYTLASASLGAIGGAAITSQIPKRVTLAEGVEVDVSMQFGQQGVDVSYGATTIALPNIPIKTPLPTETGLKVDITRLDIPLDGSANVDQYANVVGQYDVGVAEPVSAALTKHIATGGLIGAVALGVGAYSAVKHYRNHRKYAQAYKEQNGDNAPKRNFLSRFEPRTKAAALAGIAALALVPGVHAVQKEQQRKNALPQPTALHVDSYISTAGKTGEELKRAMKLKKTLSGITVSGTGGTLINTAAHGISEYMKSADSFWERASNDVAPAYDAFYKKRSLHALYEDPDIVPILHISDFHCNYPAKQYIEAVVRATQPAIVANTGDTFTNSDTMPYEKNCRDTLTEAIQSGAQQATIIESGGNHDPNHDEDDTVKILHDKNNFTVEAHGIRFAGHDDPETTTWNPPSNDKNVRQINDKKRRADIAKKGHELAKVVCNEENAAPTIVLTHRMESSYESLYRGCAALALSGHTHNETPLRELTTENGTLAAQHTAGSVTGAEVGITIYQKPNKNAPFSILFFDKNKQRVRTMITGTLRTDGAISFAEQKRPISMSATDIERLQTTLQSHRPDTAPDNTEPQTAQG